MRKTLEETWLHLETEGEEMPRRSNGLPLVPDRMPSFDDEEPLGFSYFKEGLEDADLSDLTLPRTFLVRSEFLRVSFENTDLTESRMCWNDFVDCDFRQADLSGCDLRASTFQDCRFAGTTLRGADLRQSSFERCDFTGADLSGTEALEGDNGGGLREFLTAEQQAVVTWSSEAGPEPPGG